MHFFLGERTVSLIRKAEPPMALATAVTLREMSSPADQVLRRAGILRCIPCGGASFSSLNSCGPSIPQSPIASLKWNPAVPKPVDQPSCEMLQHPSGPGPSAVFIGKPWSLL